MKRTLITLSLLAVAAIALLTIHPAGAATLTTVLGYIKAATVSTGDTVLIFKKTGSGSFQEQVVSPLTLNTVANGGTGAATGAAAQSNLGIQVGSVTTAANSTVTNTFSTWFSSAPVLVISQQGNACTVTNQIVSLTSSNFVYGAGAPAIVAKWVAIGAP